MEHGYINRIRPNLLRFVLSFKFRYLFPRRYRGWFACRQCGRKLSTFYWKQFPKTFRPSTIQRTVPCNRDAVWTWACPAPFPPTFIQRLRQHISACRANLRWTIDISPGQETKRVSHLTVKLTCTESLKETIKRFGLAIIKLDERENCVARLVESVTSRYIPLCRFNI